jgi:protein-disulfide isomerase
MKLLFLTVLLGAAPVLLPTSAEAQSAKDPLTVRTKGSASAPVTVYEMSDFQCPFCRRHAIETWPTIEKEYVATGKVRWVFINFPLTSIHANAVAAAEFAMCAARQDKFWQAHDILFRTQGTWAPLKNPGPYLITLVDSLRLSKAPMDQCLQQGQTREEIRSDSEGSLRSGANSTPTFYIEGGIMAGALPIQVFRAVLDSIYKVKSGK